MPVSEAQKKAKEKYYKANIKRIPLEMQITQYEKIKAVADSMGLSVNGYIKKAIEEYIDKYSQNKG